MGGEWDRHGPREQRPKLRFDDGHHRPATRAQDGSTLLDPCQRPARSELQQHVQQGDQALAVGVQKAEVAGTPETFGQHMLQDQSQELRAGNGSPLFPAAPQQQIVDDALLRPGQRPEFGRQGEGHQEVLGGHLLAPQAFQPLLTPVMLTVRAVVMAAGVRDQNPVRAVRALDLHVEAGLGAAMFHRRAGVGR